MLKFNNEHCNVEAMITVRERIRDEIEDDQFNMGSFCGTARCIAGWGAEVYTFITREHAIQAIDNVIADGWPHWQDILPEVLETPARSAACPTLG